MRSAASFALSSEAGFTLPASPASPVSLCVFNLLGVLRFDSVCVPASSASTVSSASLRCFLRPFRLPRLVYLFCLTCFAFFACFTLFTYLASLSSVLSASFLS